MSEIAKFKTDIWWFRFGDCGPGLQLKAPWNQPVFSERSGHQKPILSAFGWRLFYLEPWVKP